MAWNALKEAFNKTYTAATQSFKEYEVLINYFEQEMFIVSLVDFHAKENRQISDDIKTLEKLHSEFGQVLAVAESSVISGELMKLLTMADSLDNF